MLAPANDDFRAQHNSFTSLCADRLFLILLFAVKSVQIPDCNKLRRVRHALFEVDQPAVAVHIADLKLCHFRRPQSGTIANPQRSAVFEARCLIPRIDSAALSRERKEALRDKIVMGAKTVPSS